MQAYCVKYRGKTEMRDAANITMRSGRWGIKDIRPVCSTVMFRLGK